MVFFQSQHGVNRQLTGEMQHRAAATGDPVLRAFQTVKFLVRQANVKPAARAAVTDGERVFANDNSRRTRRAGDIVSESALQNDARGEVDRPKQVRGEPARERSKVIGLFVDIKHGSHVSN